MSFYDSRFWIYWNLFWTTKFNCCYARGALMMFVCTPAMVCRSTLPSPPFYSLILKLFLTFSAKVLHTSQVASSLPQVTKDLHLKVEVVFVPSFTRLPISYKFKLKTKEILCGIQSHTLLIYVHCDWRGPKSSADSLTWTVRFFEKNIMILKKYVKLSVLLANLHFCSIGYFERSLQESAKKPHFCYILRHLFHFCLLSLTFGRHIECLDHPFIIDILISMSTFQLDF